MLQTMKLQRRLHPNSFSLRSRAAAQVPESKLLGTQRSNEATCRRPFVAASLFFQTPRVLISRPGR